MSIYIMFVFQTIGSSILSGDAARPMVHLGMSETGYITQFARELLSPRQLHFSSRPHVEILAHLHGIVQFNEIEFTLSLGDLCIAHGDDLIL